MSAPSTMLKIIVAVHFVLSTWATMGSWMPISYTYVHLGVLACGLWAIGASESVDAVIMMMVILLFSIVQDVILISLYEPRAYNTYERNNDSTPVSQLNEYRFALGMCILNLILKPFSAFLLFRIYQSRSSDTAFNIPGIDRIPGLGGMGGGVGGYENIDRGSAPPYSQVPVETATGHTTLGKE